MENYFDILTPQEKMTMYGALLEDRALYDIAYNAMINNPDENLANIALLFFHNRNDQTNAEFYLKQIIDPKIRLRTSMSMYEWNG